MSDKEDRKEFVEPELTKFEESLDEVTLGFVPYDGCVDGCASG